MVLVVGGAYQGKLDYVRKNWNIKEEETVDGEWCSMEDILSAKVVNHFHRYIKRFYCTNQKERLQNMLQKMYRQNEQVILIADEIGCGVVPLEKEEREYREVVGRELCKIAQRAENVHRVFCGIGQVIK